MRKKLLSVLLTTLVLFVTFSTSIYAETLKVENVLALAANEFPTTAESSTWTNKSGTISLIKDGNNFSYREKGTEVNIPLLPILQNVTPCEGGYECLTYTETVTVKFNIMAGKLTSIDITGNDSLNGTYAPIPVVGKLYQVLDLAEGGFPTSADSSTWTNKFETISLHTDGLSLYYRVKGTEYNIPILNLMQNVTSCKGGYKCLTYTETLTFTFYINAGILTSIDITGNSPLVGTYTNEPKTITISDIIETNLDFPKDYTGGWVNNKSFLFRMFTDDQNLYLKNDVDSPLSFDLNTQLTKKTGYYEFSSLENRIQFYLDNNKLDKIIVDCCTSNTDFEGTYTIMPEEIDEVSFDYTNFGFNDYSISLPTVSNEANYTIGNNYELGLLKNGELKYYYSESKWFDKEDEELEGLPLLSEIDKAALIFEIKTKDNYIFAGPMGKVVGANNDISKELIGPVDFDHAKAEGYDYLNEKTIECCLWFDAPTSIDSVDLSMVGNGWDNKTVSDVKTIIDSLTFDKYEIYEYEFYIKKAPGTYDPFVNDTEKFESGKTYGFYVFIFAKDGYIFAGNRVDENNYVGNTLPESTIQKTVVNGITGSIVPSLNGDYLFLMFEFEVTSNVDYEIIQGNEVEINANNDKDYSYFTSNAPFNKFKEVKIDGHTLTKNTDYTVIEGSTKVTLKSSYIKTLASGEHTITIVSYDGEASTTFKVIKKSKPDYIVPNTGIVD